MPRLRQACSHSGKQAQTHADLYIHSSDSHKHSSHSGKYSSDSEANAAFSQRGTLRIRQARLKHA